MAAAKGNRTLALALTFVVLVCAGTVTAGMLVLRGAVGTQQTADPGTATVPVDPASAAEPSDSPSPSPDPSPSKSPSHRPSPTKKATKVPVPPPPPKKPPSCTSHKSGTAASKATVQSALTSAAGLHLWNASVDVNLSTTLVEAVAWQETSWQSNLVSCVGALGAMQVTPTTGDWMNQRFGTSYDIKTVSGNANLGSAQLQWLTKYFGDKYFNGDYDLTKTDPNAPTLLDAVLTAYNVGYGAVDVNNVLTIPSHAYANAVERWMQEKPWSS